jgi:hypothetical protein
LKGLTWETGKRMMGLDLVRMILMVLIRRGLMRWMVWRKRRKDEEGNLLKKRKQKKRKRKIVVIGQK